LGAHWLWKVSVFAIGWRRVHFEPPVCVVKAQKQNLIRRKILTVTRQKVSFQIRKFLFAFRKSLNLLEERVALLGRMSFDFIMKMANGGHVNSN
jgi:hypothetical protein